MQVNLNTEHDENGVPQKKLQYDRFFNHGLFPTLRLAGGDEGKKGMWQEFGTACVASGPVLDEINSLKKQLDEKDHKLEHMMK